MRRMIAHTLFFSGIVVLVLGLLLYLSPFKVVRTEAFGVDIDTLTRAFEIALMGFGVLILILGLFGFFEERLKQMGKKVETQNIERHVSFGVLG